MDLNSCGRPDMVAAWNRNVQVADDIGTISVGNSGGNRNMNRRRCIPAQSGNSEVRLIRSEDQVLRTVLLNGERGWINGIIGAAEVDILHVDREATEIANWKCETVNGVPELDRALDRVIAIQFLCGHG